MISVEELCEKYAIANALEYGTAKIGPVIGQVMVERPELRGEAEKVKKIVLKTIDYVNSLQQAEIKQIAQKKYPELLKKEKSEEEEETDFIREIIDRHNETGRFGGEVHTRFPPEPNGYLHIGHATSIIMNYTIAKDYNGTFLFRFDDTNPITEEERYVKSMIEDIKWLGVYEKRNGEDNVTFGSDYFGQFYEYALQLVKKGLAYVDDLSAEEIKEYRGTLTEPGKESPYRNRTIEENLDLFIRMKKGEFENGEKVLRAKIDMSSPNLNMRDPVMYRILHESHHNTGDKWCIYPMYDWAHGLEDSIEGITHSICTLEFENHRPLYDWYLDQLEDEKGNPIHHPQQIEFARVNLSHTVLSKRRLIQLVEEGHVNGWDDPRMPTIAGMRRRGITARAMFKFTEDIGVSKRNKVIDRSILDYHVREDLNTICPRVMCVLDPVKIVITNYPEDEVEVLTVPNHPVNEEMGTREVLFSKEIFIEREDFMENPPEDYFRLSPNNEVRLKYAYIIKYENIVRDTNTGEIEEIHCTYDPDTKGGIVPDHKEVKGTIHWISKENYSPCKVILYDRLFSKFNPMETEKEKTFRDYINPDSLQIITAYVEPFLKDEKPGSKFQFERLGYFCIDTKKSTKGKPVFNRTISLKDTWSNKK